MNDIDPRTRHYGEFYGVETALDADDTRPLWVVWGNCQAEALRVLLDSVPDRDFVTCRIPPVHELTHDDLAHVEVLIRRCRVLLSQPVRDDYRDLPIGTGQMARALGPGGVCVRWPVIRYGGLYPFQVIVRDPASPSTVPPGVPYHDLRTVTAVHRAAGGPVDLEATDVELSADQIRAAAQWSVDQLARRERRDCDVAVSDVLIELGADAAHTINHPGNAVLEVLAGRILAARDHAPTLGDPGRTLLSSVYSPLEPRVIDALALDADPRAAWTVAGVEIPDARIRSAQAEFYADHPAFIDAARHRYADLLDILGMTA